MKGGYGQFCPIAQACEVLAERWTPLVVRELLLGSSRFNDIRRGVPLMSPSLLVKRLRSLEEAGVVERVPGAEGRATAYRLTGAGEALRPVLELLGAWGARWTGGSLKGEDLDVSLLMWDIRRTLDGGLLTRSGRRVVVQFRFSDAPRYRSRWWLVADPDGVQLCLTDPGYEVDMLVTTDVRSLTRVWLGDLDLHDALRAGDVRAHGNPRLVTSFPRWLRESHFAPARRAARLPA